MYQCAIAHDEAEDQSACTFTVMIPADPAAIAGVVDRVTRQLEERRWQEDGVTAVQLALSEALANAIRHGCRNDVTKIVQCSMRYGEFDDVVFVVRDPGDGFDPDGVPDPLVPANTFKPSGRGIFLMRSLMDDVAFADFGREVHMRKKRVLKG
jgi:serine/threonine-protein kinase RsbW